MAKGLLDLLLDQFFDANRIGKIGEKATERELKLVNYFGREGKTLKNVYIPKEDGENSEIDLLYITQKGIFVFESKNYSGWIFGDEKSSYWTAMLPNKEKNKFYNPIKQNASHIKWLHQFLDNEIPLFSIIVFSERCELKKVSVTTPGTYVIKRDLTYAAVRDVWNKSTDVLSKDQIDQLYNKLKRLTSVDEVTKQAHIDNINHKYKTTEFICASTATKESIKPQMDVTTNTGINDSLIENSIKKCPKCGAKLVLRAAKSGKNAGKQFFGCSNFPTCRFIQNIDA